MASLAERIAARKANTGPTKEVSNGVSKEETVASSPTEVADGPKVAAGGITLFDDIPVPTGRTRASSPYPWSTMKKGQSFFVPGGAIRTFYTQCSKKAKVLEGKKFTAKTYTMAEVKGVMVWRTA